MQRVQIQDFGAGTDWSSLTADENEGTAEGTFPVLSG